MESNNISKHVSYLNKNATLHINRLKKINPSIGHSLL